ncbi:hypothetical protein ACLMJK_002851 [Lecanora helva]
MALPGLTSVSKVLFILQVLVFKLKKATTRSKDEDPQLQQSMGLLLGISSFFPNFENAYKDEMSRVKLMAMSRILAGFLEKPIYAAIGNAALPLWTMAVRVAVELNLFNYVAEAAKDGRTITADELAEKSGAEQLLVVRIMRPLVTFGFVKQDGVETYTATPLTNHMTLPSSQAASRFHFDIGLRTIASIPEYLRKNNWRSPSSVTDGPFQYAFNTTLPSFEYWAQDPEISKTYNTFMTASQGNRKSWVDWFPIREQYIQPKNGVDMKKKSDEVFMVDVAGGRGHHLDEVSKRFPDISGRLILEDLPAVIDDIKELDPRIEKMKVDMFEPQVVKGALIYHLHFVVHDWPDEPAAKILQSIASAMTPNYSRILIREFILPDVNCPLVAIGADLSMMMSHAGLERSEKQWHELVRKAGMGLKVEKFWYSGGVEEGVVEIVKV